MNEFLSLYFSYALAPILIAEVVLFIFRRRYGLEKVYIIWAGLTRTIMYSPAIAAGGHGAAIMPFFAAVYSSDWELALFAFQCGTALVFFVIFAVCIWARQKIQQRSENINR